MQLVIYFGHHKVGSTALQSFLARNAVSLLREGILYPWTDSKAPSLTLAQLLRGRALPEPLPPRVAEPHSALAHQILLEANRFRPRWHMPPQFAPTAPAEVMVKAIMDQIADSQPRVTVLCSEIFANFGTQSKDLITPLVDRFPAQKIQLYAVLRRPDEALVSFYGQALKSYAALPPLDAYLRAQLDGLHFDYLKMVQPWRTALPDAALSLRSYDAVCAQGGSIRDFCDQTLPALPEGLEAPRRTNPSLPYGGFDLLREANHALSPGAAGALRAFLMSHAADLTPNRDIELLTPALRTLLIRRFAPIEQGLCALTGQSAFLGPLERMAAPRPVPVAQAQAEIAALPFDSLPHPEARAFATRFAVKEAS